MATPIEFVINPEEFPPTTERITCGEIEAVRFMFSRSDNSWDHSEQNVLCSIYAKLNAEGKFPNPSQYSLARLLWELGAIQVPKKHKLKPILAESLEDRHWSVIRYHHEFSGNIAQTALSVGYSEGQCKGQFAIATCILLNG